MNQRFRRTVLSTPLFTTFLRKRFNNESWDSLDLNVTLAISYHLRSRQKIMRYMRKKVLYSKTKYFPNASSGIKYRKWEGHRPWEGRTNAACLD